MKIASACVFNVPLLSFVQIATNARTFHVKTGLLVSIFKEVIAVNVNQDFMELIVIKVRNRLFRPLPFLHQVGKNVLFLVECALKPRQTQYFRIFGGGTHPKH